MTHVRAWYVVGGGHTHVRVFVGPAADLTHGKAGDLTFRNEEWAEIRPGLERVGWEIREQVPDIPEFQRRWAEWEAKKADDPALHIFVCRAAPKT